MSARDRSRTVFGGRLSPSFLASCVVILVVLLANIVYLTGLRSNDPLLYRTGLGTPVKGVVAAKATSSYGPHVIDGNDGWTAQSLGRLAAESWAKGHIPLWNSFEGLGQPLAGEQQSAALFQPFIMLNLLPNGIFLMHLSLELVAGLSTLALLRKLGLAWTASTVGAIAFALNGVFSVMTNAPFNPIAFLPLGLYGVELCLSTAARARFPKAGVTVLALAVAWMLYSGFPETTLLQAMFIAAWVVVRVATFPGRRLRTLVSVGVGALLGLLLAAPILVSLRQFLGFAFTAYHSGEGAPWRYPAYKFWGLLMPYATGPFSSNPISTGQAGYVPLLIFVLAVMGMFSPRLRGLKVLMGGAVTVFILNMYGVKIVNDALNLIPGVRVVLVYKYAIALVAFSCTVLAAIAIDDVCRRAVSRRGVCCAGVAGAAYFIGLAAYAVMGNHLPHPNWSMLVLSCTAILGIVLICGAWIGAGSSTRWRAVCGLAIAVATSVEAVGLYAAPQLSASPSRAIDTAPINFLKQNQGVGRFYTTGPIAPNYGSYWRIAQFNVNDLPVPKKFGDYVVRKLRPPKGSPADKRINYAFKPYLLTIGGFSRGDQSRIYNAYVQQQGAYRAGSVKYLVTAPGILSPQDAKRGGLKKVFDSATTDIYLDGGALPYYDSHGICTVSDQSWQGAELDCRQATSVIRRELNSPGWTVQVNGQAHNVRVDPRADFQTVEVPKGRSRIRFTFEPAHFRAATALSLATVVVLMLAWLGDFRRWITNSRRGRARTLVTSD